MKKADASGAQVALIVGADETASNEVSVKALRTSGTNDTESANQTRVSFDQLAEHLGELFFPMDDDDGSL